MFYCVMVGGAWLLWHLVFRIQVVGKEHLPKDGRGFVLASNHISAIDPVFIVIARLWGKRMLIMAKAELFRINPILSWMFRNVGVFGIERGKGDTEAVDNAIEKVKKGQGMLIFPEGTRSKTGELGKIKSGAFVVASEAGVDMIPCRIIYQHGTMRLFSRVKVCFGPAIPASELDLGEQKSAARLRQGKQLLADAWESLYQQNQF